MSKEEFDHLSFEEIDLQNQTQLNQIALEVVSKMYEKTTSNPEFQDDKRYTTGTLAWGYHRNIGGICQALFQPWT